MKRYTKTGKYARALAAVLVLAALSGCGGVLEERQDAEWELYQQALEQEQLQQQLESEEESQTAPEAPNYPESFSLPWYAGRSMDPLLATDGVERDLCCLLYEPLYSLDAAFEPVPVLCESSAWDETGLHLTLTLRENAAFWDGSALTAQDVADTLLRAKVSERYAYRLRGMSAATANRDGTVTITLTAPNRGFTSLLDIPVVKRGTETEPVPTGTGPYEVSTGGTDCLRASGTWWQGKALPVDTIPLVSAKDQDAAMYLFSSNQAELLTIDPTTELKGLSGRYDSAPRPTAILQFIGFNTSSETFASPEARKAFSMGIPREKLVDAQLAGHGEPAQFPISPLSPLYPSDMDAEYNKDTLENSLKSLGQDTGAEKVLRLLVNEEDSFRVNSARFVAESLSVLDWEIEVVALPWDEYSAALAAGDFDLYYGETKLTADWDVSGLVATGGALNYGGFSSPAVDAALTVFASTPDRAAAAKALCVCLRNETPIAPVCFSSDAVLTHQKVVDGISAAPDNTFFGLENWVIHTVSR